MTSGSHCHKAKAFMGGISGAPTGAQNARKLRFGVPRDPPGSTKKCQHVQKFHNSKCHQNTILVPTNVEIYPETDFLTSQLPSGGAV